MRYLCPFKENNIDLEEFNSHTVRREEAKAAKQNAITQASFNTLVVTIHSAMFKSSCLIIVLHAKAERT